MKKILLSFFLAFFLFFYPSHVYASNYTFFVEYTDGDSRQVLSITVNSFSSPVYVGYNVSNNTARLIIFSDSVVNFNFSRVTYDSSGSLVRNESWNNRTTVNGDNITGGLTCTSILSTNVPLFDNYIPPYFDAESPILPAINNDGSVTDFYPKVPEFDPFSAEYDDNVPVPQVITKFNVVAGVTTPIISFTNGSTDYNVVIYGRWNSINDITLRQEKLRWVYDYSSLIHGDLECWVSDEDNRTSRENFDFFSDPHFTDTYQSFLLKYPLADRNIMNDPTLFEKLTGYNEALHNFTELYMNLPNNAYSKPDFFFRYYYRDEEQNIHYSRWAHLTFPLIPPGENGFKTTTDQLWKGNLDYQISNKPLTSEEVLDVDTYFDSDQTKYNIMNNQQSYDLDEIDWTMSLSNLQSITSVFGQMPAFVATVFSCYPAWMVQLIGATITILCALAIYHGIRG